jgi:hypothetical protein
MPSYPKQYKTRRRCSIRPALLWDECMKFVAVGAALILALCWCNSVRAEQDALGFMDGVWVSISPPGPHIVVTKVALGTREASLPNLGQASIHMSNGEQGSNMQLSGSGFECYYYVISLEARTRMVWESKGGSSSCPPTTLYERVVEAPRPQPVLPPPVPTPNVPRVINCTVADPTGTPLNVRDSPQGNILTTLPNNVRVRAVEARNDYKGSSWSRIVDSAGNSLGWVITRYLDCSATPN